MLGQPGVLSPLYETRLTPGPACMYIAYRPFWPGNEGKGVGIDEYGGIHGP